MQGLVEQDFLADRELVHVDQRADAHAHLAAGVEDVHGFLGGRLPAVAGGRLPLRVELQDRAEAVRRLALLVEGVLQPEDLGLGRFQHADELGVVLRRGGELAVDVPELVPEDIDLPLGDGQFIGGVAVAVAGCGACRVCAAAAAAAASSAGVRPGSVFGVSIVHQPLPALLLRP